MILPFCPTRRVGWVTVTVIPLSDCGVPKVTVADPEMTLGLNTTCPPAGNMVVSGFRSQSALGIVDMDPLTTKSVAVYGANFIDEVHACGDDATICDGDLGDNV